MKKSGMTKVFKTTALAWVACGVLWAASTAQAVLPPQPWNGDMVGITTSPGITNTTLSNVGTPIPVILRLWGSFIITNTSAGPTALPRLRMNVSAESESWATLESLSDVVQFTDGVGPKTKVTFTYRVREGDMVDKLRIAGQDGTDVSGAPYEFDWSTYAIVRQNNIYSNAIWRFNSTFIEAPGVDPDHYDFSYRNVGIKTMQFGSTPSPVQVGEAVTWTVTTALPVSAGLTVNCYVWVSNSVPSGGDVTINGDKYKKLTIPAGESTASFDITGLTVGTNTVYLQGTMDYGNNATKGVQNFEARQIIVTPAPPPYVSALLPEAASPYDQQTLPESKSINTGTLKVRLSRTYPQEVWVRLDTELNGGPQSNLVFASSPYYVRVAPDTYESPLVSFSLPDGTLASALNKITITPVITNSAIAAFYNGETKGCVVSVVNAAPVITTPKSTDVFTATRDVPFRFTWAVDDVAVDMLSGMMVTWSFGDGTTNQVGNGSSGEIYHTFTDTAVPKTVTVRATDKDGLDSAEVQFTVNVVEPTPAPKLTLVFNSTNTPLKYAETREVNTGTLKVRLSQSYSAGDIDVLLSTLPQGNIQLALTNAMVMRGELESGEIPFTLVDGTVESGSYGVRVTPVILTPAATGIYTDVRSSLVFVTNVAPVIATPPAADVLEEPANPYDKLVVGIPFGFVWQINDVDADASGLVLRWDFGDGTTLTETNSALEGTTYHAYTTTGKKTVSLTAIDKDGGRVTHLFPVRVLNRPTVRVLPPAANPVPEGGLDNAIAVELSEEFSSQFQVALTITPANSATAGAIALGTTLLTFPANTTYIEVPIDALDGTAASRSTGFTITPSITDTNSAAYSHFTMAGTTVKIANVAPVITITPVGGSIPQDVSYGFSLGSVVDVDADLPTMQVRWSFGDGTVFTQTGTTGSVFHTYGESGTYKVQAYATDKDGGRSVTVEIEVTVAPSKLVLVTPIGPNYEANYWGASGLGNGQVFSDGVLNTINRNNVYYFRYGPSVSSAALRAVPYKTDIISGTYVVTNFNDAGVGSPGVSSDKDSFFYVWVGTDQGLPAQDLVPAQAGPTTAVTLPSAGGGTGGGTESVDIRVIQAVFSREWRKADNMGDINQDGIPDKIATLYNLPSLASGTAGTTPTEGSSPIELINVGSFNKDKDAAGNEVGDFLPGAASGGSAIIGGISNVFATVGDPFTAILEVRGFHLGLNNETYNSDPDFGTGETDRSCERPTDPTLQDTDGDNFPDGWEYYFWYNAKVRGVTGLAYTPTNVAVGTLIPTKAILTAFDPLIPATDSETGAAVNRDLDNDGLSDIEELTIGTNPIQWDTDFDGICDGWEVLRGLNPNDQRDALNVAMNNPDGDYMARAEVPRQLVTLESGTQCLVPSNAVIIVGEALSLTADVTGVYRYGGTNAPYAAGRPLTGLDAELVASVVTTNALLLHNQVYQAFGFDPRTAWAATVNPLSNPQRFPAWVAGLTAENIVTAPNTKPFTSLDEYLLLKYMAELRLNYSNGAIGAGNAAQKTADWTAFSTHPLTPDSDVAWGANNAVTKTDRMPDGWELYVSLPPGSAETVMAISPWDPYDGDWTFVGEDNLHNNREFHGTDCSPGYTNIALYGAGHQVVTITRPATDSDWVNKFWPTDPYVGDTDGDGMKDDAEMTFVYGSPVADNGTTCTPGGGLNPCSMDTDSDQLPDAWESAFTYTGSPVEPQATTNGMNGTVSDWDKDWDRDGLANYQEYWVQAVRSFRYDFYEDEIPMDGSAGPSAFFTPVTNAWDFCQYPWGDANPPLWVMLPVGPAHKYVSTDPRDPDTDGDGMDDFYEMFHGLNPILGDTGLIKGDRIREAYVDAGMYTIDYGSDMLGNAWGVGLPMDFVSYPWLAGLDEADPDADGLRNMEEQLQADTAAPSCSNTDPTPMWMTDASSTNSLTARSYGFGGMFFWPGDNATLFYMAAMDYKMFSFEMNEGYDTDNDGISDKSEMLQTATTQSDPQDHDDPRRRQAIWFSGANSAAQAASVSTPNEWAYRSFTVELWARPEKSGSSQVLIERPVIYGPSDLSTSGTVVRLNFRIGLTESNQVYAMFQNAGVHDAQTGVALADGPVLALNKWVHLAARMDGAAGKFQLFVNGSRVTEVGTALIPANGVISTLSNPGSGQYPNPYYMTMTPAVLVLGAANRNTDLNTSLPDWPAYAQFFQGYLDEVRVWDGARSELEIRTDYAKRYTKTELLSNRRMVRESQAVGGSRVPGVSPQLPPELMCHYTFDNLFGSDSAGSVAKVPRGFNYWETAINRPAGYGVGWWSQLPTHSSVYSDYGYVPWIENGVEHLPIFGGLISGGTNTVLRDTDTVRDSVHWSHYAAGVYATPPSAHGLEKYEFPNSNDPYGYWYKTSLDIETVAGAGTKLVSDLLPLGGAWAKQAVEMWDNASPAGVWADMADDLDADGLADWWERDVAPTYFGAAAVGWYDLSANGMTAGELYMRDLAKGYTEANHPGAPGYNAGTLVKQTSDIDGDGLPDWWENLFNLKPTVSTGDDGAMGDPDRDGLSNYAEYLISEVYPFNRMSRPDQFRSGATQTESDYFVKQGSLYYGEMFADHDFMEDAWEDQYGLSVVSRYVYDPFGDPDQDGWSNWAECRYASAKMDVRPDLEMSTEMADVMNYEFPVPVVETTLSYNGIQENGDIVMNVYSTSSMDGQPDAVYTMAYGAGSETKSEPVGYWRAQVATGFLSPGNVVPGSVTLNFTDMWTKENRDTGFDADGLIYSSQTDGGWTLIGTINYTTGEYTLDLNYYAGRRIVDSAGATNRSEYIECDLSYIKIDYSVSLVEGWPKKLYLGRAGTGHLREGANYFFAFMDLDGSGTWNAGEPCGVPEPFATDIGWDRNQLTIELTDYTPGFLRMTLAPVQRTEDIFTGAAAAGGGSGTTLSGLEKRVVVKRVSVDGNKNYQRTVLDKTLSSTRSFVHEGDFGGLGLDWGLIDVPTTMSRNTLAYEVYLGNSLGYATNAVLVFTNTFDSARAKAQATYPVNRGYVYSARPTFKWSMPVNYTAFQLEIRRDSQTGPVIYNSGTVKAPARDIDGACVWTAPLCAGMTMPGAEAPYLPNKRYFWRVTALDAKYSNTTTGASWSDWQTYRLDVNAPLDSAGYGAIKAVVKYHGPATALLTGRVKVQAFHNAAFSGQPEAEITLAGGGLTALIDPANTATNANLLGLAPSAQAGDYYIRAFIDHNQNGVRDVWESWGYANYYGISDKPYDPRAVKVKYVPLAECETVEIIIEDADSDQDWFPDAWEYEQNPASANFLALSGPSTGSDDDPDYEINPGLTAATGIAPLSIVKALALGTTDADSDGVDDLTEMVLGSDPRAYSTAGDGMADGWKISLGLAPADTLLPDLTGLSLNDSGVTVQWKVAVSEASDVNRTLVSSYATTLGTASFEVLFTPSLQNPDWQVVATGYATLAEGTGGVSTTIERTQQALQAAPVQGFFRIRLTE